MLPLLRYHNHISAQPILTLAIPKRSENKWETEICAGSLRDSEPKATTRNPESANRCPKKVEGITLKLSVLDLRCPEASPDRAEKLEGLG